jgi:molecular chaperone DnaJ
MQNTILPGMTWTIWVTFLEICLAACSTARVRAAVPAADISRAVPGLAALGLILPGNGQGRPDGNRSEGRDGRFGGSQGFHSADFREKGSDLTSDVTISFDEAVSGCEKLITLQNPQTGKRQSLQVHIPAGIDTGKSIRLKGKGMPGTGGGEAGDLLLNITVTAKPGWERKEMDVYSTVRIPFTTAVFGGEALVSTLYGNVLCKIAAGTQSGTKIKLKGKGVVSMKNPSIHGDQYVTVQIDVPNHLTPEAEQKLREFEHACGLDKNGHGGHNGRSAA